MAERRGYHHGSLRQALIDRAVEVLRTRGVDALSLRELARDVGVSHGAPQRHFADRQALLEALAAEGFALLGRRLREAAAHVDADVAQGVRAVAAAFVAFAAADPELLELMFAHQQRRDEAAVRERAYEAFAPLLELLRRGEDEGLVTAGGAEATGLVVLSTLQGLTALASCGVIADDALPALVDDAVTRLVRSSG